MLPTVTLAEISVSRSGNKTTENCFSTDDFSPLNKKFIVQKWSTNWLTIWRSHNNPPFMGTYSEEQIDRLFYALSDQSRRQMLLRLTKEPLNVTELGEPLGMSKQGVSKHLNVLEDAGLITKEKDGRIQRCQFNPQAFEAVQKVVQRYREFWEQQLNVLGEYIEKAKTKK